MIRKAFRTIGRRLGPKPIDGRFLQAADGVPFTLPELLSCRRDQNESVIRSLCFSAYLGEGTALCRVLGRYKMLVDTGDMGVSVHLIGDGFWEMEHTEATMSLLKPGMKAVDIGANLGYFSLLMSDIVGPSGSVHSFEPNPAIATRLRHSLEMNGFAERATVHELALFDQAGEMLLAIPDNQPRNGHIVPITRGGSAGGRILTERFDAIPVLADADYIKIDVEGAERELWRGMAGVISSGRPLTIVLEFTPARYPDAGMFLDEILSGRIQPVDRRSGARHCRYGAQRGAVGFADA